MFLSRLAPLLIIPFVAAEGVHKLKLKKLQPTAQNPALETAYLAEKYGGAQVPLMGAGIGRDVRLSRPSVKDGEQLFWTQDEFAAEGGHTVPLSSKPLFRSLRSTSSPSSDFMNAQYFAEISLGTPPQTVS